MYITMRLRGKKPTNSIVYSPEPRAEVYCLTLNFEISKLGYLASTMLLVGCLGTKSTVLASFSPQACRSKGLQELACNASVLLGSAC